MPKCKRPSTQSPRYRKKTRRARREEDMEYRQAVYSDDEDDDESLLNDGEAGIDVLITRESSQLVASNSRFLKQIL